MVLVVAIDVTRRMSSQQERGSFGRWRSWQFVRKRRLSRHGEDISNAEMRMRKRKIIVIPTVLFLAVACLLA